MAISDDLFRAILAMDAYNRGYNSGVGPINGGLGGVGSQIGLATVLRQEGGTAAQSASFFAQAYSWAGKTVISYRGTDQYFTDVAAFASSGCLAGNVA